MGILFLIYTIFLFLGLAGSLALVRSAGATGVRRTNRPFMGWLAGIVLMLIVFAASASAMRGWPNSAMEWRELYSATIGVNWLFLIGAPFVCIGIFELSSRTDEDTGMALTGMVFSFVFSYALIHTFFIRTHPEISFSASMGLVFGILIYLAFFNQDDEPKNASKPPPPPPPPPPNFGQAGV